MTASVPDGSWNRVNMLWETDNVTEEDVTSWSGEYYYYDYNYTGTSTPVYSIVRDGTKLRNGNIISGD